VQFEVITLVFGINYNNLKRQHKVIKWMCKQKVALQHKNNISGTRKADLVDVNFTSIL